MSTGIYIHLPYCLTKCPYCDFNSYGTGPVFPEELYTSKVLGEIGFYQKNLKGRTIDTIFFGGGTPSLFSPESISRIIRRLSEFCRISDDAEITLEVNPRTADVNKLRSLKSCGVNRISVGIQSFLRKKLDYFERHCTPDDCHNIIDDIRTAGFENFNIDLMYGAYGEVVEDLAYDLETSVGYLNGHISVYCLTIEKNTEFGRLKEEGNLRMADDDQLSDMYSFTSEFLSQNGFNHYETSNFARSGHECRHNLIYWRCHDYFGFGAGAHSHISGDGTASYGERWSNNRSPKHYMKDISEGLKPVDYFEVLNRDSALQDRLVMGLRLSEGVDINEINDRYGVIIDPAGYRHLVEDGFLKTDNNRLSLTEKGFLYSDRIILEIVSKTL